MKSHHIITLILLCVPFSGCVSMPKNPTAEESLVVLAFQHNEEEVDSLGFKWPKHADPTQSETELESCLENAMAHSNMDLSIVPAEEFRSVVFPDFSRSEVPRTFESISLLLNHPEFKKRIAHINLKYLVLVGGSTQHAYKQGDAKFYAIVGARGGVAWFWGKTTWDHESSLNAIILDLDKPGTNDEVRSKTNDTSWFGIYTYIPLGKASNVTTTTCESLSDQIIASVHDMRQPDTVNNSGAQTP